MNAGLPGTGVGGLFLILIALWMPFRELYRTFRGQSSGARWRFVALQLGLALSVILSLLATYWLVALALTPIATQIGASVQQVQQVDHMIRVSPSWLSVGALMAIIVVVELAGLVFVRLRPRQSA